MKKFILGVILLATLVSSVATILLPPTSPADASGFNPGRIIDDAVFTDTSMTEAQIQAFLNNVNSHCLKNYRTQEPIGGGRYGGQVSAARAIWRVSQEHRISPKVILATLEKEQGLVTRADCPDWRYQTALGYGCPDTAPCSTFGFSVQLHQGARHFRGFFDQAPGWIVPYTPGTRFVQYNPNAACGGSNVTIQNRATASLYSYTPYQPNAATLAAAPGQTVHCGAYGNINFWRYFNQWFGSTTTIFTPKSNVMVPNGIYTIQNPASSRLIDVIGARSTNGTGVQLLSDNRTNAQRWTVTRDSNNYYSIKNVATGNLLDVAGGSLKSGAKAQTWQSNSTCAQRWAFVSVGQNIMIQSACSGLALDLINGRMSNGTGIQLWDMNHSAAQQWQLVSQSPAPINNGFYEIKSPSGLALDVVGASTANETPVQIWDSNSSPAQQWQLTRGLDGLYTIRHPMSGRLLDAMSTNSDIGATIRITSNAHKCSQKWIINGSQASGFNLQSSCSSNQIDVRGGAITTPGSLIQMWNPNTSAAQRWNFVRMDAGVPTSTYSILSTAGKALEVSGGNLNRGTDIQLWEKNRTGSQSWHITRNPDDTYSIFNIVNGRSLDIRNARLQSNTPIQIWDGNGSCVQKWNITDRKNGTFVISSACSNSLSLDIMAGQINTPGSKVQLFNTNGSGSQVWVLAEP